MVLDKKTKRDVVGIAGLGIGLGVLTKVESVAAPPVPVVTKFAPLASTAGIVVGAGTVIRQLNRLPLGKPNVIRPIKRPKSIMRFL